MGLTLSTRGRWNMPEIHWSFEQGQGKPYFAYHFGAQVAEVLVDTGTGKVEVAGLWAAHNTGKIIFPQGALGQLYGGIAQGLGYALIERVDFDNGYIQATNFDEYLIRRRWTCRTLWVHLSKNPLRTVLWRQEPGRTRHGSGSARHFECHFSRHRPADSQPAR